MNNAVSIFIVVATFIVPAYILIRAGLESSNIELDEVRAECNCPRCRAGRIDH